MWLPFWLRRIVAGCSPDRPQRARRRPRRGETTRRLSVERLEDRLTPSAGALDTTFGTGGTTTTDFTTPTDISATIDRGEAVALQSDGKIVVVGSTDSGGSHDNFALARYLANGDPDDSFSGDGKTATDFDGGFDLAHGVAIQADGKIVVVGQTGVRDTFAFALARYLPDGRLDDSFDGDGKVTTPDFGTSIAFAVAIQADGKIVVAGTTNVGFALARYKDDGSLDKDFDGDGMVTSEFPGGAKAASVAIQADGKIVAAGTANFGSSADFALARYSANGGLDSDFRGGKFTTDFDGDSDQGESVAIQADGKIVVAGSTGVSTSSDFAVARYSTNGSLDSDFDADGKVTTDFGSRDEANSVVIQSGRIVVAGSAIIANTQDFALTRYNFDGTPDASFGASGKVTTNFGGAEEAFGMALQPDGKIVAAGLVTLHPNLFDFDFGLARYEGVAPEIAVTVGGANLHSGATVAFGATPVGAPLTKTFTIRNLGNLSLTVSSLTLPAGYQLTSAPSFPFKVAAGGQISLSMQLTASTAGVFSGKVSIGTNDSNENPFLIGVTGTALAPAHEIQVLNGTTDISDNTGAVNLGTTELQTRSDPHIFTVRNIGNTNLTLGPGIAVPGFIQPTGFGSLTGSATLAPGASTTFGLALDSSNLGTFSGKVSFATNDSDENPFNFTVTGAVGSLSFAPKIRGESLTRQVDEDGVATVRGHLVDSDALDELFLRIDWADGTEPETHNVGHAPFAFEHRYLDDVPSGTAADEYLVQLTWFDSGGGSNSKSLPVTVRNVAPQVSAGLPVHLQAGDTLSRVGSFTDPGLDSWYATVDYDDGRGPQWLALGPDNHFTLTYRYTQPGVYHVRVRVFDDDGGIGADTFVVTVRNVPSLDLGGAEVIHAGDVMQHTARSTDSGTDTWIVTVDYGDGSGPRPLAIQPDGHLLFEHRYKKPGTYRVTVTVLDDDGGLSTDFFLVIVLS